MRADKDAEKRGLSRPVRADNAYRFARREDEIDFVKHAKRAKGLGHALRLDQKVIDARASHQRFEIRSAVVREKFG
jgi:hypothetical protein